MYESIIGAIKEELQAARQRAATAAGAARAAEERVKESMYYSRDKFKATEEEVKRLTQVCVEGGAGRTGRGRLGRAGQLPNPGSCSRHWCLS